MTAAPRIYIADHEGMVGAAILNHLRNPGHPTQQMVTRNRRELDLVDQAAEQALLLECPEQIYLPLPGHNGSRPRLPAADHRPPFQGRPAHRTA